MRRVIGAFFRSEVQSGRAPKTSTKQNATVGSVLAAAKRFRTGLIRGAGGVWLMERT